MRKGLLQGDNLQREENIMWHSVFGHLSSLGKDGMQERYFII